MATNRLLQISVRPEDASVASMLAVCPKTRSVSRPPYCEKLRTTTSTTSDPNTQPAMRL